MKTINNLFAKPDYGTWNVEEYFDNDEKLMDGVEWITKILSLDANNIDGKIVEIDRAKHQVKVGFKKESDQKIYLKGADKYVCSYGKSYNVTTGYSFKWN